MKLRNKKTGEAGILRNFRVSQLNDVATIELTIGIDGYDITYYYHTLSEVYAEWEDYTPPEPLIKDKQTREEIKLFAYRNEINCFKYQDRNGALYNEASNGAVISLEVSDIEEVEHLVDGCLYTLAELCGEEE